MKGLILKDIYGCRFQIIGGFAIMLLPMLMTMAMGGGVVVVDNRDPDPMKLMISIILYGAVNYMSIVVSSSFYLNTLSFDEKSGWTKMQRAMPLTGGQIISAKFLGAAAVVGSMTLISLGFDLFNVIVYQLPVEPLTAMPLCIGLVELITLLPAIVFGYRFGAGSVTWVYFVIMALMAVGIITLTAMFFIGDITAKQMRIAAYGMLPVLAAIVIAICFFTGKRAVTVDI